MSKTQYSTKQMIELTTYLKSVKGEHVTVNDISRYFISKGISVGTTTIYRQLEKMVAQGTVAKYIIDGTSSACFQYVGDDEHINEVSYHCKCEKCGKLIHIQCEEIEALKQHMMSHHNFEMDCVRTVFYGVCEECR